VVSRPDLREVLAEQPVASHRRGTKAIAKNVYGLGLKAAGKLNARHEPKAKRGGPLLGFIQTGDGVVIGKAQFTQA
jgi:hypothetical protein